MLGTGAFQKCQRIIGGTAARTATITQLEDDIRLLRTAARSTARTQKAVIAAFLS